MQRNKKLKTRTRHSYQQTGVQPEFRVRLPKGKQVLGIVEIRLGFGKSNIKCADGKTRICKVPGSKKRRLWVRQGDTVLVEPWDIEGDKKGNIIHKYKPSEVDWLKKKGYFKELLEASEF